MTEVDPTQKVLAGGLDPEQTLVSSIMSSPVFLFMHKNNIHHLPITEENQVIEILFIRG